MRGLATLLGFISKGGIVNYIILMIYLFALYIIVDRAIFFIKTRYAKKEFLKIIEKIKIKGVAIFESESIDFSIFEKTCIKPVFKTFENHKDSSAQIMEEILVQSIDLEIAKMRRGLIFLSRVVAAAPLLGLLGTVTGLMSSFHSIASLGGSVDITLLSGGIWEAMITTATGLATALFSFLFYEVFNWLTRNRDADMQKLSSLLVLIEEENQNKQRLK